MVVNKYLVLHSGDRILMQEGIITVCIKAHENFLNENLEKELTYAPRDIRETASHIELILEHKDK